jgi:GNAT superfamily N-acetyltransferase
MSGKEFQMAAKKLLVTAAALACGLVMLAYSVGGQEGTEQEGWRRLILSEGQADRRLASELVIGHRRETVSELLKILDLPLEEREDFYAPTSRNTAIGLLGKLRAAEAAPALAQWLAPRAGQGPSFSLDLSPFSPAGTALVEIGMPAVPVVMDLLAANGVSSEDSRTWVNSGTPGEWRRVGPPPERVSPFGDECLRILVSIKGLEETEAGLRRAVSREDDEARKKNLEDALAALLRPALRQTFENRQAQKEAREDKWAVEAARKAARPTRRGQGLATQEEVQALIQSAREQARKAAQERASQDAAAKQNAAAEAQPGGEGE